MSRLIDRCLMLAAGGLLGFAAARAALTQDASDPAAPASSAGASAIDASTAAGRAAAPATPPGGGAGRTAEDRQMQELVGEVVGLRPDRTNQPAAPLSEDEIDRCLVVAQDIDPPLYEGLMALRAADPVKFRERLSRSTRLRFLANLRQDEPHLYELKLIELRTDREVARLSAELRAAATRGDEARVERLTPSLVAQMRMQQAFILLARKQTLDRMREKLEQLEAEYQADLSTVDERIAAEIERLIEAGDQQSGPGARGTSSEAGDEGR